MKASFLLPLLLLLPACGGEEQKPLDDGLDEPAAAAGGGRRPAAEDAGPPPDPATYGSMAGTVYFDGQAPVMREYNLTGQTACLQHLDGPAMEEHTLVRNGRLQNAVVYIRKGLHPGLEFPVPAEAVDFDQLGCVFRPHVVGVRAGQTIHVNSGDDEAHNVRASGRRNDVINFTQPPQEKNRAISFKRPEVAIPIKCDIHPWMNAWIAVFGDPYFAISGADGRWEMQDVPPGQYTLRAWHEKLGTREAAVTVGPNGSVTQDFRFEAKP